LLPFYFRNAFVNVLVLYKEGPPFYHASYIVIVEVADADSLLIDSTMSSRSMTWNSLFGIERLSETAAKVNLHLSIQNIICDGFGNNYNFLQNI